MRVKNKLIIVILALIIYFLLNAIYVHFFYSNEEQVGYILSENVKKGEEFNKNQISEVKLKGYNIPTIEVYNLEGKVYNSDYDSNILLSQNMLMSKDEYVKLDEENEIVSIKVKNLDNNVCNTITKGSIVNIYASAKISDLENIINSESFESYTNDSTNGFATLKILSRVKVEDCFDSDGKRNNENAMIENILITVSKDMAMKINNLKNFCDFSLSYIY